MYESRKNRTFMINFENVCYIDILKGLNEKA